MIAVSGPLTLSTTYYPTLAGVLAHSFNPQLTTSAICNAVLPLLDEKGCMPHRAFLRVPMATNVIVPTLSVLIVVGQGLW